MTMTRRQDQPQQAYEERQRRQERRGEGTPKQIGEGEERGTETWGRVEKLEGAAEIWNDYKETTILKTSLNIH